MIKKILKAIGLIIGAVLLLAAGFYLKASISTNSRMNKVYAVDPQEIDISDDSATLALGKRLVVAKGCEECHGEDLGGKVFIEDPAMGRLIATNLTKGKGGLPQDYSRKDWVLALKHGLSRDMKPLLFMPAHEFTHFTEEDLGAIIAYCEQLRNVDREHPDHEIGPMAKILTELGEFHLFPAEMIDHEKPLAKHVEVEVSADYGKYLTVLCQGCHRENMKGGKPIAPGFPPVVDISSTGNPGKWTEEQFINTLRTGKTPEGKQLKPEEMPWTMTAAYTDVELKAIFAYLMSI